MRATTALQSSCGSTHPIEPEVGMQTSTTRTLIAICALVLCADPLKPLWGQTGSTGTVIVAMFEDYPAFNPQPPAGVRAMAGLRALVIRRDFADEEQSVIILNPAYATPEVLFAALVALRSRSGQEARLTGVTERGTPAPGTLPKPVRSVLSAIISDLVASQQTEVRGHLRGKQIVLLADVERMVIETSRLLRP